MILSKVIQWTQKKEMDESPTILQSKWFKLDLVYVYVVCRAAIIDFEWVYGKNPFFKSLVAKFTHIKYWEIDSNAHIKILHIHVIFYHLNCTYKSN